MPTAKPEKGKNDLATLFPEIAKEWHPVKNGSFVASDFKPGSKHVAWWLGKCGHEWESAIYSRTKSGKGGCPICLNLIVLPGFNDLATTNPQLASEWHPIKNGNLTPSDVTAGSLKYAWWKCKQGHEWRALIRNRNQGNGCPKCKSYMQTSFPEQSIYYYIKKACPDAISRYSDCFADLMELDIFIPSLKIGIEYDGTYWHSRKSTESREKRKYEICKSRGIFLCRIREKGLGESGYCDTEIQLEGRASGKTLDDVIQRVASMIGVIIDCDTKRDSIIIQENYRQQLENQSLQTVFPDIAAEWHPTKNKGLEPSMFSPYSGVKVWWKCSLGHTWQSSISQRSQGYGCPYCGGKEVLPGFNDLSTRYPHLALEWHPTKNGNLKPTNVSAGSNKKVWWLCSQGHEWSAKVDGRTDGRGCPYCSGKKLLVGFNDLATTNPKLATEWHPTKNGTLLPTDVFESGRQYVWWKCKYGHEWKAQLSSRAKSACPFCGNKKVAIGYNDLQSTHPEIALEWHPTKNGRTLPTSVTAGSRKKVWWICPQGHEYQMSVNGRHFGGGCPYCTGKKVKKGFNDLATTNAQLAMEWNPKLNDGLTPEDVTRGSAKKVWWTCAKGHDFQMSICQRNLGSGCPYCSNHRLLKGYNDLETVNPTLAAEWHPTKNGNVKPSDVLSCTDKKVWWKCSQGHEWEATIAHRKYNPNCPKCRK